MCIKFRKKELDKIEDGNENKSEFLAIKNYLGKPIEIITLKGDKNSGKTTALRCLYVKLLKKTGTSKYIYEHEGADDSDFSAKLNVNGKIVVIKSMGDGIKFIRDGLDFAKKENADVLINAWNNDLDKKYSIRTELPGAIIIDNHIPICETLRKSRNDFNNKVISYI